MSAIQQAVLLHQSGELSQAEALYREVLSREPDHHDALHLLGLIELQKGCAQNAIDLISRSLARHPDNYNALDHLGEAYRAIGQFDEAITCFERAVGLKADFFQAYNHMGIAHQKRGQSDLAIACFRKAVDLNPQYADGHANLANAVLERGQAEASIAFYRRSLDLRPMAPVVLFNLGNAFKILRRYREAIANYRQAIAQKPDFCDAWLALARCLQESGDSDEARRAFEKACAIAPQNVEARWGYSLVRLALVNEDEAAAERRREDFSRGLDELKQWFDEDRSQRGFAAVGSHQPFYLAYYEESNRDLLARYGELCGQLASRWQDAHGIVMRTPRRRRRARLRLGVASAHLRRHSVWDALIKGWCAQIDRERIELHVFSLGPHQDTETDAVRRLADDFDAGAYPVERWAQAIVDRQLDVLIYPEIGMDATTLKLASLRLAPVQAVTWGHPETTGLPTIDYYLSAEDFEPESAEPNYTERLVRLPHLGCFYQPSSASEETVELASLGIDDSQPVFVCSGAPFKYGPRYDFTFVEIARRLGRCQFVLFRYQVEELFRRLTARLQRNFVTAGLEYERYFVEIPWMKPAAFAAVMRRADVYLDTIGFSGFNTAMQAIEAGLPIVTVDGRYMRGRLASGILKRLGMPDTVTESADQYVERAVTFAQNGALRDRLRARIEADRGRLVCDLAPIRALESFLTRSIAT
jgi:predicted O-linked N-acetylglucosamine transferase (SPINDLY family)